jgi:hypothetical protein
MNERMQGRAASPFTKLGEVEPARTKQPSTPKEKAERHQT